MKTLILLTGLLTLMSGCKREGLSPQLAVTELNLLVINQANAPLASVEVVILGSTGSYFGGTRRDSTFAKVLTNSVGRLNYKATFGSEWRVYVRPNYYPTYNDIRFQDGSDGILEVGKSNDLTAILIKR